MSDNSQFQRKPAKRLFAVELNDATHQFQESDDDRAPNWSLLPTGEKANRVFIAGTLTETSTVGNTDNFWQGRILDNSTPGDQNSRPFFVKAGQYQPEPMTFLQQASPPSYVAVVGKPTVYDPDDNDRTYVSVRPESINVIDKPTRNNWVIETANHTIARVQRFAEARDNGELTPLMEDAIAEYGSDLQKYRDAAVTALDNLEADLD